MHGALIPYFASFWMAGSRDVGLKIGLLLFCVLQKSTDSSAIYKLTIGLGHYLNFKGLVSKKFSIPVVFFTYGRGQENTKK
jgi:hypothetical protein